jgi:heme ABC exporter ATP-binding subunit CcmA
MVLSARLRKAVALAGRYPVLAGADLDLLPGEILVVRGPNGAGKTSLLRVLAGLLPLVAGEAEVLGLDPTADARALRPLVGLLGHHGGLYDDLTAEQNVRFAAKAARTGEESAKSALLRLGLGGRLAQAPAGKLSAGQRRRLALACLLAKRPALWLLDEPHAGLDAEHRALLDELLAEVAGAGSSVVMASHEEAATAELASRVVSMAGGTVRNGLLPPASTSGAASPPASASGAASPPASASRAASPLAGVEEVQVVA